MTARPPKLWVDVSDLADYLIRHNRPSGIQRVAFEICAALYRQDGGAGRVGFVLREEGPRDLVTGDWREMETAYASISNAVIRTRSDSRLRADAVLTPTASEIL